MSEGGKKPNWIPRYIVSDVLEDIFVGLPLKSILRLKSVSKEWRSILESKRFVERRKKIQQKSRKQLLAVYDCNCGYRQSLVVPKTRFQGDEEMVYLHCDAERPSLTCDGLLCFPEPYLVKVLNPTTGQLIRFPTHECPDHFLENWVFGFGKDKVNGRYKVVKISEEKRCYVADVETGAWRTLTLPPHVSRVQRQSVYVNGSIFWLFSGLCDNIGICHKILALDVHKEELHIVSLPATWLWRDTIKITNLEDRLAIAGRTFTPAWILEIYTMDHHTTNKKEETWSKTYSIRLDGLEFNLSERSNMCFTPVALSKQGNIIFHNNHKRFFKYYQETDEIRRLSSDVCVISPYLENLVRLGGSESSLVHHPDPPQDYKTCRLVQEGGSKFIKGVRFAVREILITAKASVCFALIRLLEARIRDGSVLDRFLIILCLCFCLLFF